MGVDLAEGARFALKHINPAVSRLAAAVSAMAAGDGEGCSMTTQPRQQGHSRPAKGATRGKQGQPAVTVHAVPHLKRT